MRKMKDSGIEWIGEIPEDWEIIRIKYLADSNQENSFVDGDWIESTDINDAGIRYLTTGNIGDGKFKRQGSGYITEDTFYRLNCKYAYPGDLTIARLNAPYGRSCILPDDFEKYVLAVDIVILRPQASKEYLCYLTQCGGYQKAVEDKSSGTTMKRVSRINLGNIFVPLPALSEQQRIANFLDSKCAEIDALTADIQSQIDTLEQYKRSLITETVTKGLNPNVEMKDSGVEWVEKIPQSWKISKTLYVLDIPITDGPHITPTLYDEGIPFVSAEAVCSGHIDFNHIRGYISEKFYKECCLKYKPQRGDIYMVKSGATTGKVAMVETDDIFTIWSPLAVFRANQQLVLQKYLFYSLQSLSYIRQVEQGWSYGTQQNIGMRVLEGLKICVPPIKEQEIIVNFLNFKCTEIDSIIEAKKQQIETLSEYKKSLIFEYVTGKKEVPTV